MHLAAHAVSVRFGGLLAVDQSRVSGWSAVRLSD